MGAFHMQCLEETHVPSMHGHLEHKVRPIAEFHKAEVQDRSDITNAVSGMGEDMKDARIRIVQSLEPMQEYIEMERVGPCYGDKCRPNYDDDSNIIRVCHACRTLA